MNFDVNAARSAGYSDDEIADFLAKENNFDLAGAVSSGYSASEVVSFLTQAPADDPARQELPAGVAPSTAGGGRGIVNPPLASEPQPQQEQPGFFGRLADSFGTGIDQAKAALSSINVTAQNEVVKAKREQLARLEASGMADSPDAASLRTQLDAVTKRQGQYIADLAQKQQALAAAPVYQGVRDLGQAQTFGDAWSIFAKDPVNIALNLGAQSLPAMAPGIITSAINPVAGMAVMGASSAGVEFGSTIMEFAQKNGVDTSNRDALASFYSNPEMLDAAKSYAATRAGIIGLADTASAGIASKTLVPKMITGPVARVAANTVAQMGVQGVSGGVGEAGAQIATEGRITSPGEVVAEIAGEFAGAPLEVAGMRANVRKERELGRRDQPSTTASFTPPDSVTAQAGLAPVVVPLPQVGIVQGEMDASATGPVQRATADGSGQRGDLGAPGVEPAGLGGVDPIGDVRPGTDGMAPVDGAPRAVGDAGVQQPTPVAGDPLKRTADTELLRRAEAAQPAPAAQPATIWTGRAGDGYVTRQDAEVALPTRVKREPDLRWEIEQMPSGKFRLAGYAQQEAAPAPTPASTGPQLTAQQFMQNPAQAIETAQQITFAPGQMGAVKVSDRKALNATFTLQEMDDGTTVFTRSGQPPSGQAAVAGGLGQRAAQPSAEQQSAVLADLNKASAGRFAAVAANTSFTGVAQRIAAAFGRPVMLIRDRNGNAGFNALFYPRQGVIAANVDSDRPMYAVVTHEVYHGLPDDLRQRTTEAVMATVTPEQRARFLSEFAAYQKADAKTQDEELAARIIEQDAENPQFWQKLADRMGDSEFAKLAREILGMLDRLLAGFTREDSSEFTSDIERVREVVADAYAEAQARMGQPPDADAMASTPRKRETIGEYRAIPYKDGSTTILGDVDEIRSKLPDDVKGRVVDGGIRFTTSDSQRVRAALEGRQVAYSRAGAVLDKLPMKDGKYLGAPPDYDTPAKIPTLRKILRNLTKEGEAGRFWYENSSKAVLRMTGGNVQEARKFVALLAIYSPQAKVDTNTTFAIRAWSQYKAGQPISVKTKVMDQKAAKAMEDIDAFWSGEKTGNFFFNLLREIDPTTAGKQGATIDMWMMRAGMYPTDAPTKTQYACMENETNRIAAEMGWEPQQVQAAIWVAMKARMENSGVKKRTEASSEKKGWIRFDRDAKGKKVRVILDAQKHRDNWLAHAMRHVPSATDTKTAKFDFEDGLLRHIGQISFEARPGRTSGSLPGIHSAPYAQQVEFQQAVQKTFYDERGTDMLASYLGLMIDNDILAPGVWQGEVSPSTQMSTVMAPVGGKDGKNKVDPAQAKLLNIYASVLGLLTRQEGVGWHRPFYATTKRDANGLDIDIGRAINPQETADLERSVGAWMQSNGHTDWQNSFAFVSSPKGIRLVNFGIITNEILQTEIVKVAESVLPDGSVRVFASDGDMPTNNWKENPNGQTYVQGIRSEGRPDVLDWARAVLAPRVDAVFRDFADRYSWGDPGEVRFSAQRDGAGRQGAGRAAPGSLAAPERAAQEAALTPLPGAPKVPGFHGPDPRLVAVAEKYAADNGIVLRRQAEYVQVDPERAARIAEAYEAMPHAPQDAQVREAYENLIRQTRAQYDALVDAGYQFWFMDMNQPSSQEYASTPWNAMRDIRANQQMGVFPTEDGFGTNEDFTPESNPLLADTGLEWPSGSLNGPRKRVLANDLFRAVHDAFGHGLEGAGFRAQGEENAWQAHVRLFTGSAVGAITSETRGQNSWLNYGPYGEANRTAQVEDTVFADQKTGLMPEWTWTEGRVGDMPMASAYRAVTETPEFKRWFGDSKVVDADGKPLVVYHATTYGDFDAFSKAEQRKGMAGYGFYFTDRFGSEIYADYGMNFQMPRNWRGDEKKVNVMPVYLHMTNPLVIDNIADVLARYGKRDPGQFGQARQFGGMSPDAMTAIQRDGFDGVITNEYVKRQRDGSYNVVEPGTKDAIKHPVYVTFEPEQIKSAIGNNGQFDPENADIRMSANRNAPIQGSRFTLPGMDGNRIRWDKIRRALQDDDLRMKRVQDAVLKQGGTVNEEQNFYDANTLMPGRVQTMMDDFRRDVIKPMIEKAAKAKIDLEELALYAYAKHAEERNNYIASINPRMPDGGSGMTTADANKILADIAASGKQAQYDDLHQDLMSITETTRRVLLDEGLITQEQFDAMEQQYGSYIPLRGFENVDEETGAIRPGIGRGINVRGKETIKALGRASRAGDLIENVIRDYQRAVVRSEKNNVGKVLLDFVLSNPDPDLWGVDVDKTTASFDKKRGIVQYTKAIDKGEDTIGVKVAGQQVYIKLADKDLTRALKQSFKDEVSGLERATVAMSGWYNNLMRNVLTRYNPPFAMVNAIRDAQSGLVAAVDELGAKGAARFSAHLPKAIAATTADETNKMWLSNPLTQQYLREFKAAGAVTGGFFMRNLEDIAQDLRDDLLMAGAAPRTLGEKAKYNKVTKLAYKGSVKFLRALELMGAASENATRFALYMAARDMGRTPAQAALLAKNGTTNFNRKGEWGGALNNLYLFFNAAVQGNAQLFKTLKNPKVAAALTGVAGLTVSLAFLNAGMGGEDDDGEKYWDKIPGYEKERNLIIMLKPGDGISEGISRVGKRGRYIKIPVQYGLNFFTNLGYSVSDVIRNAQDPRQGKAAAKAGMHMASTFFGSLNPFGGALDLTDGVSVAMAVAPTIVDLPIQIGTERNAFGTPTAPTPFPGDTRPDSERMFISQMDGFAADLAKAMNRVGGGNEAKAGKILGVETAVTPGTIKTIIAGTSGGLGAFFEQIYDTATGLLGDDKNLKTNRIPLLNKVYGEAGEDVNVRLAGDRMREVGAAVKVIENQIRDGIKPDVTDEDKRLMSIASAQEIYNKESARLRKDEIDVIRSTTMTPEQKRIARDNIMAARDRMATSVNRVYLNSFGAAEKGDAK